LRFLDYTKLDEQFAKHLLPENKENWRYFGAAEDEWSGYEGFFVNKQEVEKFLNGLHNVVKH
jgi:hypothetical protein